RALSMPAWCGSTRRTTGICRRRSAARRPAASAATAATIASSSTWKRRTSASLMARIACLCSGASRMSLYYVQKLMYQLNRDASVRKRFDVDRGALLAEYELTAEERAAIMGGDIGLLYVM